MTEKGMKRRLKAWSTKLHLGKTMSEALKVRHLADLLYQALRYLFETYTEAASITDRPGPCEYAEYGTAAFADAAGPTTGNSLRESLSRPHRKTKRPGGNTRLAVTVSCSETPACA